MTAPERIWASSVTENYGEWQTVTDGMPRPTEYVRADLVPSRCTSCDGSGDVHRADGEWIGECNCGSEFRHAFDVEANSSKAYHVIRSQAARIAALEAQLAEANAENAALRHEVDRLQTKAIVAVNRARDLEIESYSRTGAVKVLPATGHYVDRLVRIFRDRPDDDGSAVVLQDYALSALEATPPAPKVTEGEWREVQTAHLLKGRRRSPAYFPATGEVCEVSGPNCDNADGYTWGETTVLWQNEIFVLYGSEGFWPVLHKHEHVLFQPLTSAQEAGK